MKFGVDRGPYTAHSSFKNNLGMAFLLMFGLKASDGSTARSYVHNDLRRQALICFGSIRKKHVGRL